MLTGFFPKTEQFVLKKNILCKIFFNYKPISTDTEILTTPTNLRPNSVIYTSAKNLHLCGRWGRPLPVR